MSRTIRILALCLGFALAPLAGADELGPLLTKLNSRSSSERSQAEAELKKVVGPAHLPQLVSYFKSCQIMACYVVVRLVQNVGGAPAQQALRQMVRARTDYGAYYAANSLKYQHKDDSGMQYLLGKVLSPQTPENFRYILISYLTSMGEPGKKALLQMASDAKLSSRLRTQALNRLADWTGQVGDESGVIASLQEVADPKVRVAGDVYLYARGKLKEVDRLDAAALAGKLEYSQWYTLMRAIERRKDKARKKILTYLVEKGPSGYIKAQALKTMAAVGLAQQAVRLARKYTSDKDQYLRREARRLMVKYGDTSIEDLKKQLERGPMIDRLDAAEILLKLDDMSGEKVVIAGLKDRSVTARRKAAEIAGLVLSRDILPPLADAMNDADSSVRIQANSAFRQLVDALLPYRNLDWKRVGYAYNGPAEKRKAAVEKLKKWLGGVLREKK